MLFPTVEYALFFLVAFAGGWALHRRLALHKSFLLAASWFFYGWWDVRFLPILAGISLLAFGVAWCAQRLAPGRARSALLTGGIVAALSTLAFFKYLAFLAASAVALLGVLGVRGDPFASRIPSVALPVGISFFVFHAISLMVDASRGKIPVRIRLVDSLLYVAFFPQLVAGPILRASSFLPELSRPRDPASIDAARALERIAVGLVKKVLIASFLSTHVVDPVFDHPSSFSGFAVLIAIYSYAAQIFCDFSGYTDIAIGSALLLGYPFPENFDAPYSASSPRDFWRRWHLSLSTWLRDYLFVPLGGSRSRAARTSANLLITMILGGLWHGASWTFVCWGAMHGLALVIHRAWADSEHTRRVRESRAWRPVAHVLAFHFVCLTWVFFRAPTFGGALDVLRSIAQPWSGTSISPVVLLSILLGVVAPGAMSPWRDAIRVRFARLPLAMQGAAFASVIVLIECFGPSGVPPFIYFRF